MQVVRSDNAAQHRRRFSPTFSRLMVLIEEVRSLLREELLMFLNQ